VDVHTLAHFDPDTGCLIVSDRGGGAWVRERHGEWQFADNGANGILFFTEPEAEPWSPDFTHTRRNLDWYLDRFLFADHGQLERKDQQVLFLVNLMYQFFQARRRTRLVPAFLGPQGSGKTTGMRLAGRLLLGRDFDVTGLHREREDAFIAAITNRVVVALDNADSRIRWLEDDLATYATGVRYRLRQLFTTNAEDSYAPRAILMLSSRDPHFQRPDVAERLLPHHFERPREYVAESVLFRELASRRGAIWGELLTMLAAIADHLTDNEAPAVPFRMADFAAFGWLVFNQNAKASEWLKLLKRLEAAQMNFASEGDALVSILRTLIERDGTIGPIEVGALFRKCAEVAEAELPPMPQTVQGFGMKLTNLHRVIEVELAARFAEDHGHRGKRFVTLTPLRGETGGTGDTVREKISDSKVAE
jgi:hypothetical protein